MRYQWLYIFIFLMNVFHFEVQSQPPAVWTNLFNGKNLKGWSVVGGNGKVVVEDGNIVLYRAANSPEHTFLRTNKKYKNFILEVECKRESDVFYGIFFRAIEAPNTADTELFGYQIKPDHLASRGWTGGIFDDFGTTWNWIYVPDQATIDKKVQKPAGEWDHYRIEAIDDHIAVWVNDIPVTNMQNTKYDKGHIALKIHSMGDNKLKESIPTWARNVKIVTKSPEQYKKPNPLKIRLVE